MSLALSWSAPRPFRAPGPVVPFALAQASLSGARTSASSLPPESSGAASCGRRSASKRAGAGSLWWTSMPLTSPSASPPAAAAWCPAAPTAGGLPLRTLAPTVSRATGGAP
eukprot:15479923-Alexandrium_andersonii.AAC.1